MEPRASARLRFGVLPSVRRAPFLALLSPLPAHGRTHTRASLGPTSIPDAPPSFSRSDAPRRRTPTHEPLSSAARRRSTMQISYASGRNGSPRGRTTVEIRATRPEMVRIRKEPINLSNNTVKFFERPQRYIITNRYINIQRLPLGVLLQILTSILSPPV